MRRGAIFGDVGCGAGDGAFGGLGDVVCSPSVHSPAAAAMAGLVETMKQASAEVRERFKAQANALISTWNQYEETRTTTLAARLNPSFWCQFKALGEQANALTLQVAKAAGIAPPPPPGGSSDGLSTLAKVVGIAAGAAVVLPLLAGARERREKES